MRNNNDCDNVSGKDYLSDCDVVYITDVGGAYSENDYVGGETSPENDKDRYSRLVKKINAINSYKMEPWDSEYLPLEYTDTSGMEFMDVIEDFTPVKPDLGSLANEVFSLGGFYLKGEELCRMSGDNSCFERTGEKTLKNFVRDVCASSQIYENFYTTGKFNEIKDRVESLCRLWGLCISEDEYGETCLKGF